MDTTKISRVEIIDYTKSVQEGGGRCYVYWDKTNKTSVELHLQDEGRTLKVFISKKN